MFLMTVAMAAIGLGVDFRELRQMGLKGFYAGLISAVALAGFSLALLNVLL
jgi:uncharacterized membrane protein YadS